MQRTLGFVGLAALATIRAAGRAMPVLTAGAFVASASIAGADIKGVDAYYVVVINDGVHMKASDANIYYPVRILKAGEVLRVDGEGSNWLRVEYLPGTKAHVKADEATFDEATKTIKLTRPTKLMAVDARGNPPWWGLLDADVPTGTTFTNVETVKAANGTLEGFHVPAPAAARGYVRAEAARRATEVEAKTYLTSSSELGAAAPAAPKTTPAPETAPVATAPVATAPVAPATTTPDATTTPSTITMGQPAAPGTVKAETPAATTTTAPAPAATTTPVPRPAPVAPPAPPTPEAPKVTDPIQDLQVLRTLFDNVMQSAGNEAEIQTVISEFNRTMGKLGSNQRDTIIRSALNDRLGALKMRQEIIDLKRRAEQNDTLTIEKMRQVRVAIEEAQKQAIYQIVGRMLPSTVYDGRRGLPLMYRIESPDSSVTRTLGYIVPRDGIELLTKTGKVVGIVGESKFDPALGVNIVAPRRVDVLEIVGGRLQVITDTSTTTTTTNINGQSTSTSTKATTTTTTGGIDSKPAEQAAPDQNK